MTDFYGTASGFRSYLTTRGITAPTGADDDDTVGAKLVVSSEWLDARYNTLFPGRKTNGRSQEREWPRLGASDHEGYAIDYTLTPVEVEYATYEAARREFTTPGVLSRDYTPNKYQKVAVSGAVSVDYTNFNSAQDTQIQLQIVSDILRPLLRYSGDSVLSGDLFR
jgi:hypothetical protein